MRRDNVPKKFDIDEKDRRHIYTPLKLILRFNGLNGFFAIQCMTTQGRQLKSAEEHSTGGHVLQL